MKNKKTLKVLALALAFVLVAGIAVGATMAYLTSTPAAVKNVFTVGKVTITLDETKTDEYGVATTNPGTRNNEGNEYKLIPNKEYLKDPIVHVKKDSEPCYVFVKVENGLVNLEATTNPIATQITTTNSWTALPDVSGVYYKTITAEQLAAVTSGDYLDLPVFDGFTLASDADTKFNTIVSEGNNRTNITVTAYAIQYAGFESNVAGAWTAVSTAG